jgi:hypothetical protein
MTSANVTKYRIVNLEGMIVGKHSQHAYCKTHWGDLLKFTPPENYTITAYGLDEEEEEWENDPINLAVFLDDLRKCRARFDTWDDIMKKVKP